MSSLSQFNKDTNTYFGRLQRASPKAASNVFLREMDRRQRAYVLNKLLGDHHEREFRALVDIDNEYPIIKCPSDTKVTEYIVSLDPASKLKTLEHLVSSRMLQAHGGAICRMIGNQINLDRDNHIKDIRRRIVDSGWMPNPWSDLPEPRAIDNANHLSTPKACYPASPSATSDNHRAAILRMLPNEILHMIVQTLPQADISSLAVTNKELLTRVGARYMRPIEDKWEKYHFVKRFESTTDKMVACASCAKLHPPWSKNCDFQDQIDNHEPKFYQTLPVFVTSNPIRRIALHAAKYGTANPRTTELVGKLSQECVHMTEGFRGIQSTTAKFVDGSLILRNQVIAVLMPDTCYHPRLMKHESPSPESIFAMRRIIMHPKMQPCAHKSWEEVIEDYLGEYVHLYEKMLDEAHWGSGGGCIYSCKRCTTDFAVLKKDIAGLGRTLVLTWWKDLGGLAPSNITDNISSATETTAEEEDEATDYKLWDGGHRWSDKPWKWDTHRAEHNFYFCHNNHSPPEEGRFPYCQKDLYDTMRLAGKGGPNDWSYHLIGKLAMAFEEEGLRSPYTFSERKRDSSSRIALHGEWVWEPIGKEMMKRLKDWEKEAARSGSGKHQENYFLPE